MVTVFMKPYKFSVIIRHGFESEKLTVWYIFINKQYLPCAVSLSPTSNASLSFDELVDKQERYWKIIYTIFFYYGLKYTSFKKMHLNIISLFYICKIVLHVIKTYISNLVCTTRFWNNLHHVHSKSKVD
jgi:hypothetical protein